MSTAIDSNKIAQRAYQIFEERGKGHGSDLDDWIKAEQEILTQEKPRKKSSGKKTFA